MLKHKWISILATVGAVLMMSTLLAATAFASGGSRQASIDMTVRIDGTDLIVDVMEDGDPEYFTKLIRFMGHTPGKGNSGGGGDGGAGRGWTDVSKSFCFATDASHCDSTQSEIFVISSFEFPETDADLVDHLCFGRPGENDPNPNLEGKNSFRFRVELVVLNSNKFKKFGKPYVSRSDSFKCPSRDSR